MGKGRAEAPESWGHMVLRSMPPPSWLAKDAPHGDVVLSSRARYMRNLRAQRFPHHASPSDLIAVWEQVQDAIKVSGLDFDAFGSLSPSEREYFVACRLLSPEFQWDAPGRGLLLDSDRSTSLMVNEEDHVRLQALTAGWSVETADLIAERVLEGLQKSLEFAWSPRFGFLAASPYNAGQGRRLSAMFHLIGLAHTKRLPVVLKALTSRGLTARGLFGESSRAVGAFVQVSIAGGTRSEFVGACEYLLREEREARSSTDREMVRDKAMQAVEYASRTPLISLADSLRILAWSRWATVLALPGFEGGARNVDTWLTTLEPKGVDDQTAARQRGDNLRGYLAI
jgi:protein arginine kinase